MKENVRVVDCCATCRHAFVWSDYESDTDYFCNKDKDRPSRCGSIAMGETWGIGDEGAYDEALWDTEFDMWEEWARDHEVRPFNICDGFASVYKFRVSVSLMSRYSGPQYQVIVEHFMTLDDAQAFAKAHDDRGQCEETPDEYYIAEIEEL